MKAQNYLCCRQSYFLLPDFLYRKVEEGEAAKKIIKTAGGLTVFIFVPLGNTSCSLWVGYQLQLVTLITSLEASLHIPGEFPGNSRGTGKFPRFGREPLPQNVPVIQGEPSSPTKMFSGNRSGLIFFLRETRD